MKSPIQRQLEIFSAALERPAGPERDAFIAHACATDDALRLSVETLIANYEQAGAFLAKPAEPVASTRMATKWSTTECWEYAIPCSSYRDSLA